LDSTRLNFPLLVTFWGYLHAHAYLRAQTQYFLALRGSLPPSCNSICCYFVATFDGPSPLHRIALKCELSNRRKMIRPYLIEEACTLYNSRRFVIECPARSQQKQPRTQMTQTQVDLIVGAVWLVCVIVCFLKWKTWTAIFGIIGSWLGIIAIILSPLSKKSRSDYREDFDRSYSRFYTVQPSP
jgi:hypothetical protein